jgi:Protein of unknown function (DUF2690)
MKPIILIVSALAFAAAVSTASDVRACGLQYDGTNPHTTGCDTNATTICTTRMCDAFAEICAGLVELRYSYTCHTAWSRISGGFTAGSISAARIERNQDGCWSEHVGFFSAGYSSQLYDGVGYSAYAHGYTQSQRAEITLAGSTCSW